MEKQKLMDMDLESLQLICVNPYEVNPITQHTITSDQFLTDVQFKDKPSTSQPNRSQTKGDFSVPQEKKIKLELEEFGDLSLYVPITKPKSQSSVDELNAPIFEKNLPGYDLNFNYSQSNHFIKLENKPSGNNIIANNIFELNSNDIKDQRNIEYKSSGFRNIEPQNSTVSVVSTGSYSGSVYDTLNTQNYVNDLSYNMEDRINLNMNNNTENMYSNASSPAPIQSAMTTPENSTCSSNCPTPKLSLNVNLRPKEDSDLATPTIIEDVVELENGNFNILEFMQNESISCDIITVENLFESANQDLLSSGKVQVTKSSLPSSAAKKRPRKRHSPDDDDDDYVPPSEKNLYKKRIPSEYMSDSDSDDDIEMLTTSKGKTRGRPPKRTGSISSDCSKESDASKYRELRDKNNEASRRSRLKRKLKEQELESEADELYSKNIKLKAQVEELEKLVTKFREDLFKIMIRK